MYCEFPVYFLFKCFPSSSLYFVTFELYCGIAKFYLCPIALPRSLFKKKVFVLYPLLLQGSEIIKDVLAFIYHVFIKLRNL